MGHKLVGRGAFGSVGGVGGGVDGGGGGGNSKAGSGRGVIDLNPCFFRFCSKSRLLDTELRRPKFHSTGFASDQPGTRMHATAWPGDISRSSGSMRAHSSMAIGQRVRKRQPDGGLIGVGTSP